MLEYIFTLPNNPGVTIKKLKKNGKIATEKYIPYIKIKVSFN